MSSPWNKRRRGKKSGGPPFVQIFHWMMESAAWRDLGPVPQAVYLVLKRYYTGSNNGTIGLSCRQAADAIGVHYSTTSRAFKKLIDHGFIVEVSKGVVGRGSGYNRATEWLLEECRDDRNGAPPRKPFMQWSKDKSTVAMTPTHVAKAQRNGKGLPPSGASRSTHATSKPIAINAALHQGNTLTSSHRPGTLDETRGAAGPQERSKPRVARTGADDTAPNSLQTAELATKGPRSLGAQTGNPVGPIQVSEALRSVLQRAHRHNFGADRQPVFSGVK